MTRETPPPSRPTSHLFGLSVAKGGSLPRAEDPAARPRLPPLSLEEYERGVLAADRAVLGRAISLIESRHAAHERLAHELLGRVLPRTGGAVRVGITGVPGAGKSTFIERIGVHLCGEGHRVAVLAVDPSSRLTGGSILGDRTRMGRLSGEPNAFIRPSPSGDTLGGVARRTREAMLLCEAAGFDVVIVETVGVGQSETAVAGMSDCFLLLAIPGAGDELQGIKRGVLELVDVIAVNKADGDNLKRARLAARELANSVHFLRPAGSDGREGEVPVLACSALTGSGVPQVWDAVERHLRTLRESGTLAARRRAQDLSWFQSLLDDGLRQLLENSGEARAAFQRSQRDVAEGSIPPAAAAQRVLDALADSLRASAKMSGPAGPAARSTDRPPPADPGQMP